MKIGIIPYQEDDLVKGGNLELERPRFPTVQNTHIIEAPDGTHMNFVKPEDIPLNRRNFVYRPCAANPLFSELGYCCSEYPFHDTGMNLMDRSEGISTVENSNDAVSVKQSLGWRTARSDVCIKEGETYWEIEVIKGGLQEDFPVDVPLQRKKDILNTISHLRLGVSKREASLEAPIGFDSYGYGLRDHSLESIHEGKIDQTLSETALKPGDRLGFLLKLPSLKEQKEQAQAYIQRRIEALTNHNARPSSSNEPWNQDENGPNRKKFRKAFSHIEFQKALLEDIDHDNIIRDHIAIRYKNQLFFEATDYVKTTKPEYYSSDKRERQDYYRLPNSYLYVYLNGEPLGKAFEDLKPFLPPFSELQYKEKFFFDYWRHGDASSTDKNQAREQKSGLLLRNKYVNNNRLGYYPTISCFNGGTAKIITKRSDLKYHDVIIKSQPNPSNVKVLETLFQEQIAEEIVWDIIDEVEEELNGAKTKSHG